MARLILLGGLWLLGTPCLLLFDVFAHSLSPRGIDRVILGNAAASAILVVAAVLLRKL